MCAKLHTVAASNDRDHAPRSLYYCLFALRIQGVFLSAYSVCGELRIPAQHQRSGCNRLCPPCTHTYPTAITHPPFFIWKIGTTLSQEGVMQGDNAAMAMYALSTRPLIQVLKLQMMKWNRYGIQTIALQSSQWQVWKMVGIPTGQRTRLSVLPIGMPKTCKDHPLNKRHTLVPSTSLGDTMHLVGNNSSMELTPLWPWVVSISSWLYV